MAGALGVALGSTPLTAGAPNGIEKISGAGFQRGQDETSLWTEKGLPVSRENKAEYVRLASKPARGKFKGGGKYEFSFNGPLLYGDVDVNILTLEISALVEEGSGDHWQVDMFNTRRGKRWEKIGDLSKMGSDWSTSNLVVMSDDGCGDAPERIHTTRTKRRKSKRCISDYFDTDSNEVLIRIHTRGSEEVVFIDYAHVQARFGFNPHSGG
ncbi:unnamed protein product, partial [Ectocarpus sp. 8 AP-2014]